MRPAYSKKVSAYNCPSECKHSLPYDRRPDWRIGLRVGMWNIGSRSVKGGEDCEKLRKRMIDVCCLQGARWRGQDFTILEMEGKRHKQWWSGKGDGIGHVGVIAKEKLCEVVEVKCMSVRPIAVVLAYEEDVLRLICGYDRQSGRGYGKKQSFYDELK